MKKCPHNHIYPESLSRCPICEKNAELQTMLGKSPFVEKAPLKNFSNETYKKKDNGLTQNSFIDENDDNNETIFMGKPISDLGNFLAGWLIELNTDDMPVKSYELFYNKQHHIGRAKDNDIVITSKNKSISRYHCMIEYKDRFFIVHDKKSTNGIRVNKKIITSETLTDGSSLTLGNLHFRVKYMHI